MKASTFIATTVIAGLIVTGGVLGGLFLIFGGNDQPENSGPNPAATPEPTPTPTPDPVTACLDPTPTTGDGPGTTATTINDRPVESGAIEARFSSTLASSEEERVGRVQVNENLSVVARQHAQATAGGQEDNYALADSCELNTVHATILEDNIDTPTSPVIADTLYSEFTSQELSQIRADHDAVGIGVYISNGEIHITIATLDTSN